MQHSLLLDPVHGTADCGVVRIVHQAISVTQPLEAVNDEGQYRKEPLAVLIIDEYGLPGVSPRCYMIDGALKFHPQWSFAETGKGVALVKVKRPDGVMVGAIEITGPKHLNLNLQIQPMFRYPSDLHPGELLADSGSSKQIT